MTSRKKRKELREPLTDEEESRGETYYDKATIDSILSAFAPREGLDKAEFARRLEGAAAWYVEWASADPESPPSTVERKWGALAGKFRGALEAVEALSGREASELTYGGDQLARRRGSLPDFPPEKIPLERLPSAAEDGPEYITIWPAGEQIRKSVEAVRWLHDCVTEAQSRAAGNKEESGGNRPNDPLHHYFRSVVEVYRWAAARRCEPRWDREDEQYYDAEMLDFLDACLIPLGIRDSETAIYQNYRRAVWEVEEALGVHLRERRAKANRADQT